MTKAGGKKKTRKRKRRKRKRKNYQRKKDQEEEGFPVIHSRAERVKRSFLHAAAVLNILI